MYKLEMEESLLCCLGVKTSINKTLEVFPTFVIPSHCSSKVTWGILQGQIKTDSKDADTSSLCLSLGADTAFSVCFVGPVPTQTRSLRIM